MRKPKKPRRPAKPGKARRLARRVGRWLTDWAEKAPEATGKESLPVQDEAEDGDVLGPSSETGKGDA